MYFFEKGIVIRFEKDSKLFNFFFLVIVID